MASIESAFMVRRIYWANQVLNLLLFAQAPVYSTQPSIVAVWSGESSYEVDKRFGSPTDSQSCHIEQDLLRHPRENIKLLGETWELLAHALGFGVPMKIPSRCDDAA